MSTAMSQYPDSGTRKDMADEKLMKPHRARDDELETHLASYNAVLTKLRTLPMKGMSQSITGLNIAVQDLEVPLGRRSFLDLRFDEMQRQRYGKMEKKRRARAVEDEEIEAALEAYDDSIQEKDEICSRFSRGPRWLCRG